MSWQLQDAKNRFSQLVKLAESKGPQIITVRGQESVVVISVKEYKKLITKKGSLVDFMQNSPMSDVDLDLERSKSKGRNVSL